MMWDGEVLVTALESLESPASSKPPEPAERHITLLKDHALPWLENGIEASSIQHK